MSPQTFKIRREILVPFGIIAVLMLILLVMALAGKGSVMERTVLAVITLTITALFLEARNRRVTMTDQGVSFRKFLQGKDISWGDISHVGCVIVRSKVYLLLTTTRGFMILSNAYGDFVSLIGEIVQHIDPDKVDEDVRNQVENHVKNRTDIVSLWIAVTIIFAMIILKLLFA